MCCAYSKSYIIRLVQSHNHDQHVSQIVASVVRLRWDEQVTAQEMDTSVNAPTPLALVLSEDELIADQQLQAYVLFSSFLYITFLWVYFPLCFFYRLFYCESKFSVFQHIDTTSHAHSNPSLTHHFDTKLLPLTYTNTHKHPRCVNLTVLKREATSLMEATVNTADGGRRCQNSLYQSNWMSL